MAPADLDDEYQAGYYKAPEEIDDDWFDEQLGEAAAETTNCGRGQGLREGFVGRSGERGVTEWRKDRGWLRKERERWLRCHWRHPCRGYLGFRMRSDDAEFGRLGGRESERPWRIRGGGDARREVDVRRDMGASVKEMCSFVVGMRNGLRRMGEELGCGRRKFQRGGRSERHRHGIGQRFGLQMVGE